MQTVMMPTHRSLGGGDSSSFSSIFPWTDRPGQAGFEFSPLPRKIRSDGNERGILVYI
jgi:hypothetical protein